jgi:hypothetical protein
MQTGKPILSVCTFLLRRQDESLVLQKPKNAPEQGCFDVLACNHSCSNWLLINLERFYS